MEGDFNMAMKIFIGARLVNNALSLNLIPDECYGSRPSCTAIQLSLNCTLTADITWQSRASLVVASVDCLTCYDSVRHPPASIASQHLGSPQSLLEKTFDTIQNMQISLRTAFGDSSSMYSGSASVDLPFQGVCQGNGAGLALWLATSILLIETLHHHGYVSKFSCPISGQSTSLTRMIYIDDCDLIAFFPPPSHPKRSSWHCNTMSSSGKDVLRPLGVPSPSKNARGDSSPSSAKATTGYHTTTSWLPKRFLFWMTLVNQTRSAVFIRKTAQR